MWPLGGAGPSLRGPAARRDLSSACGGDRPENRRLPLQLAARGADRLRPAEEEPLGTRHAQPDQLGGDAQLLDPLGDHVGVDLLSERDALEDERSRLPVEAAVGDRGVDLDDVGAGRVEEVEADPGPPGVVDADLELGSPVHVDPGCELAEVGEAIGVRDLQHDTGRGSPDPPQEAAHLVDVLVDVGQPPRGRC